MLRTAILLWGFLIVSACAIAQINDRDIRLQVLKKAVANKEFVFGKWTEDGQNETHLTYLGELKTKTHKTYRVMNSIWIWGASHRATSRILFFDDKDQYLGNYYVTTPMELPTKLQNGQLLFSDVSRNKITNVDLRSGIPKVIADFVFE